MTTKTGTNGQVRKTLADQIDRLDSMLDGLSDGLNDAVAQAVKDAVGAAVQQAVQAVLREALTNPELVARLAGLAAPAPTPASAATRPTERAAPAAPKMTWAQRWVGVGCKLTACVTAVRIECGRRLGQAGRCVAGAWNRIRVLGRFPYSLMTAAVVAMAAGVAGCFTQHWWMAAYAAVYGFVAMVAVRIRETWKRLRSPAVEPSNGYA